ncbi:potassium channel SKOR-like protein [Tanacetum coccineum]
METRRGEEIDLNEEEEYDSPFKWQPSSDGGRTATSRFLIHPQNWWYLGWKHLMVIWAVYSSFFTPLEFGFFRGLPEKLFLLDIAGQLAFLIDIVLRFFVAYKDPHSHRLICDHNLIAIRYLKSRFVLDVLGCLPLDAIYKDDIPLKRRLRRDSAFLWKFIPVALENFELRDLHGDMILGAYLLGNMAALIVKGSKTERFRDKMTDLNKYMNKNKLGRQISKEIKSHVRLQYESSDNDTSVLQGIPASFRAKISQKLYEPYVKEVPLFKGCSLAFIKQIVLQAIKVEEELFLPGEVIIEEGSIADQLYIVCHGTVVEDTGKSENESGKCVRTLERCSSLNEISVLCNIPVPDTVRVGDLSKLLRVDKQSLKDILEVYFSDGRIILENLLEGKETYLHNKILESDITLHVEKHELELALRLNSAVHNGDFYRVKRLVAAGLDPNKTDYDGRSPLHIAAIKGYEDIVQFLMQKGAMINLTGKFFYNHGNSPLLEAIKNGQDQVVSMLVEAGASLDMNNAGNCLCMAVANGDLEFVTRVLANGINPNSKNYDLRTPLHIAAAEGLYSMSRLILEAGGSVFSKDRWGNTPLDEARVGGTKKLVKLLEDTISGADIVC